MFSTKIRDDDAGFLSTMCRITYIRMPDFNYERMGYSYRQKECFSIVFLFPAGIYQIGKMP